MPPPFLTRYAGRRAVSKGKALYSWFRKGSGKGSSNRRRVGPIGLLWNLYK